MAKESFVFVPYHASQQNLAAAKLANSEARSHAAAVSRQRKDNQRLRSEAGLQHLALTTLPAHDEAALPEADEDHSEIQQCDSSSPTNSVAKVLKEPSKVDRRQRMRAMQFSWRAGNVSSGFKFCNGTRLDPFSSISNTNFGRAAVDYYWQVMSPVNQPIYAIFNVTNTYASYWGELMMNDDYKPAGLAVVGAIMQRVANPECEPSRDVRALQACAISRVQKRYKEAVKARHTAMDEFTIMTVLGLAQLARFLGDLRSYESHRSMLKDMVRLRGGLNSLGHEGLAKCVLLQWDSFWVFETDGEPMFPRSRPQNYPVYPVFPLHTELRETFIRLPSGFQSLILKGKISIDMIEILGRVSKAQTSGIQTLSNKNMFHSEIRKYTDFLEACPCLSTFDSGKAALEKYICLATLLYCFNTFVSARSSTSLFTASRTELTRLLIRIDESEYSPPERESLFWVCAVCIDSWRKNSSECSLLPGGHCLLPILSRLRQSCASSNTLEKFFFNQNFLKACNSYSTMSG